MYKTIVEPLLEIIIFFWIIFFLLLFWILLYLQEINENLKKQNKNQDIIYVEKEKFIK